MSVVFLEFWDKKLTNYEIKQCRKSPNFLKINYFGPRWPHYYYHLFKSHDNIMLSRILPGIEIVSCQIFVCGGEVLANGEVRILASHWLIPVTWPEYWPLIGLGPSSFKLETNKLGFFTGCFFISLANPGIIIPGGLGPKVGRLNLSSWASHFRHQGEQMPFGCSNVRLKLLTLWRPLSGFNYTVDWISKHIYLCFCFNSDAVVSF